MVAFPRVGWKNLASLDGADWERQDQAEIVPIFHLGLDNPLVGWTEPVQ
jgi:hypothetical protein